MPETLRPSMNTDLLLRVMCDPHWLNWQSCGFKFAPGQEPAGPMMTRRLRQFLARSYPFLTLEHNGNLVKQLHFHSLTSCFQVLDQALQQLGARFFSLDQGRPFVRLERLCTFQFVRMEMFCEQVACHAYARAVFTLARPDHPARIPPPDWPYGFDLNHPGLKRRLSQGLVEGHVHLGGVPDTVGLWYEVLRQQGGINLLQRLRKVNASLGGPALSPLERMRLYQLPLIRAFLEERIAQFHQSGAFNAGNLAIFIQQLQDQVRWEKEFGLESLEMNEEHAHPLIPQGALPFYQPDMSGQDGRRGSFTDPLLTERSFLTQAFYLYFHLRGVGKDPLFEALFPLYLVLQNIFHRMVTQHGRRSGLGHFLLWYDTPARSLSETGEAERKRHILERVTGRGRIAVEGRVTPSPKVLTAWVAAMKSFCEAHECFELGRDLGLIAHFIKSGDDAFAQKEPLRQRLRPKRLRHAALRRLLARQALALEALRRHNSDVQKTLVGIDAARDEADAPPEVFAHIFRYLRRPFAGFENGGQLFSQPLLRPLGATYHVGESFTHPLLGLRRLVEAIRYLDLRAGDRLGHAFVLGLDAPSWTQRHGAASLLTREERFDCLVWIRNTLDWNRFSFKLQQDLDNFLAREFSYLYPSLGFSFRQPLHRVLAQAWSLRYWSPEVLDALLMRLGWVGHPLSLTTGAGRSSDFHLAFGSFLNQLPCGNDEENVTLTEFDARFPYACLRLHGAVGEDAWLRYGFDLDLIRKGRIDPESLMCLWFYFFDTGYQARGQEACTMEEILPEWHAMFANLQSQVVSEINRRKLVLEVCPSSNVMIGGLDGFEQHPIFKFYPPVQVPDSLPDSVRVMVCTDDPGIFSTNLAMEYALLAQAAYHRGHKVQIIEAWIEDLKRLSREWLFLNRVWSEGQSNLSLTQTGMWSDAASPRTV